jgi:hypothetical protein
LGKRLEAAEEEALGTPSSPKKDRQKAIIRKWEEQQLELERQIHNLTITEGDVTKFAKYWHEVRSQLKSVLPIELDMEEELDESGKPTGDKWAVVTYQGVALEDSRLRNLLKNLGFKVTLYWKAQTVTDRKGKTYESRRFHQLDHAEIAVGGKHSLEGFNNKYTHVHNYDTD